MMSYSDLHGCQQLPLQGFQSELCPIFPVPQDRLPDKARGLRDGEKSRCSGPSISGLNSQQQAAVAHRSGHLSIIAGAGTGKTHTLVYRAASLIKDGIFPYQICALTFTNKAADEMRHRLCSLVANGDLIASGTYHAYAARLLRRSGYDMTIIDTADVCSCLSHLKAELHLDLPPQLKTRQIAELMSYADNTFTSLETICLQRGAPWQSATGTLLALQDAYQRYKQAHALADYDDLLYELLDLLARDGKQVVGHLRHVLADEMQDTNPLQLRVLRELLAYGAELTSVGDPCQSIYGFRGAVPALIQTLPDVLGASVATVKLSCNYRSAQPVLDYANALLAQHPGLPPNPLRSGRQGSAPVKIAYVTEAAEARAVAGMIKALISRCTDPSEIAVLYAASSHGIRTQLELSLLGVRYVTRGGQRVTDSAHARDMRALLRLALDDDQRSLRRILQLLPGIGEAKAQQIAASGLACAVVPSKARQRFDALLACIASMRQAQPADAWAAALAWYEPHLSAHGRTDLAHLGQTLQESRSVKSWLDSMALQSAPEEDSARKVVCSTIHSAKGLEWRHVFVIGLSACRFPRQTGPAGEELLRLLYVACTRARDTLHLSAPLCCQMPDRTWRPTTLLQLLP